MEPSVPLLRLLDYTPNAQYLGHLFPTSTWGSSQHMTPMTFLTFPKYDTLAFKALVGSSKLRIGPLAILLSFFRLAADSD